MAPCSQQLALLGVRWRGTLGDPAPALAVDQWAPQSGESGPSPGAMSRQQLQMAGDCAGLLGGRGSGTKWASDSPSGRGGNGDYPPAQSCLPSVGPLLPVSPDHLLSPTPEPLVGVTPPQLPDCLRAEVTAFSSGSSAPSSAPAQP